MGGRVISTQDEWEEVRKQLDSSSDYRAFSGSFEFNPSSTLRLTGVEIRKALPRAKPGGPRWTIFEKAIVDRASVEQVNELASKVGRQEHGSPETDADIFIALFTGYATLHPEAQQVPAMVANIDLCATQESSLAALRSICSWADELHLAYAWITSRGGTADHWNALSLAKLRRAVVGTQFAQTEPHALRTLLDAGGDALRVIEDTGGVFHPKVIVGTKGERARALLGSSNFTHGGFCGNTELNVLLEGSARQGLVADALAFIEQQWRHPRAFVPDSEWLDTYAKAYANRPRPQLLAGTPAKVLLSTEADLDIEWGDYFRLIEQQERRMLSTGTRVHVFDHPDASYLQEIETCQSYFEHSPSFSTMPVEQRKLVAGFGATSGHFGRMKGAGNFKNMVIERPGEIGPLLDAIPAVGIPTDRQLIDYLEGATVLRGVSIATATRLLIAKRPDLFLSVNGASRARIKEVFGSVPTGAASYLTLMKRLWAMPWFNSPEPSDEHQRRIWRVRVAILDAVMYEPTTGSGPSEVLTHVEAILAPLGRSRRPGGHYREVSLGGGRLLSVDVFQAGAERGHVRVHLHGAIVRPTSPPPAVPSGVVAGCSSCRDAHGPYPASYFGSRGKREYFGFQWHTGTADLAAIEAAASWLAAG